MKASISNNKIISFSFSLSFFLILIFGWLIISLTYDNEFIFPSFSKIIEAFFNIFKSIENIKIILITISRVLISVIVCFVISFSVVILYMLYPVSVNFFKPLIQIARSMPLAVISIFIFIIIGDKVGPYIITILMSIPVAFEGLFVATNEISTDILDELNMLQGKKIAKIVNVNIPIILPYVMMTLVQTLGMSFKVMIMGEYICQTNNSIGKTLYSIRNNTEMDKLLAYGILIIIIVSIIEYSLKYMKKHLFQK